MSPTRCENVTRLVSPPEDVALRAMKASDLSRVRALHRSFLPVSYPAAFFVQLLINPRQLCLVATDRGVIIGFASATMDPPQPSSGGRYKEDMGRPEDARGERSELRTDIPRSHVTLLTLGVLPAYRRRGIGRSLVHGVVQRLEASCTTMPPYCLPSRDRMPDQDSGIAVLVQVQVAQSNAAGKCFYTHLGMMDQRGCDDEWIRFGPGPRTSVMAGVLCV